MEIWLNPDCSRCRVAIETLDAAGVPYTIRRYLDDPPTEEEIRDACRRLGLEPWDIVRLGEPVATELGLAEWARDAEHRDRWIEAMAKHPILIQRPIITADDGHTVVGRDADSLAEVLC